MFFMWMCVCGHELDSQWQSVKKEFMICLFMTKLFRNKNTNLTVYVQQVVFLRNGIVCRWYTWSDEVCCLWGVDVDINVLLLYIHFPKGLSFVLGILIIITEEKW